METLSRRGPVGPETVPDRLFPDDGRDANFIMHKGVPHAVRGR